MSLELTKSILYRHAPTHLSEKYLKPKENLMFQFQSVVLRGAQYVDAKGDHVWYRVRCGSGMGMRHSATVSAITYLVLVELPLLRQKNEFGILAYGRYHDDIIVVGSHANRGRSVVTKIQQLARPCYRDAVDEVSRCCVSMLDIMIYKPTNVNVMRKLEWRPFIKPSAKHVPLSNSSMHPEFVHRTWPVTEVIRMFHLSIHRYDFLHFPDLLHFRDFLHLRDLKIARFQQYHLAQRVIDLCKSWAPLPDIEIAVLNNATARDPGRQIVRLVLPYHSRFGKLAKTCLAEINLKVNSLLQNLWPQGRLGFQVAWSNYHKNLGQLANDVGKHQR